MDYDAQDIKGASVKAKGTQSFVQVERQVDEIEKRLSQLRGLKDARQVLPVWKDNLHVHKYWAKQHPEKTAVEWWKGPQKADDQITYGELDQISRYIANVIVSKGLNVPHSSAKHKVSIIYIPRGIEMVVAMLAAHSAGLAFTIVDTEELTSDRVKYVWEDTSASLLFSTHFPGDCPPGTVDDNRRIYVDDLIKEFRTKKPDVSTISGIPVPVDDQTLALIIYTSGSTGKPKGVTLEHGPYANYHSVEQNLTAMSSKDRVVHTQSPSFVSGVGEVFRAFCCGATLVIGSTDIRRLGPDLIPWFNFARITVFKVVPSLLRSLISDAPPVFDTLRVIVVSGEALTQEIVEYYYRSVLLLQSYGPSETSSNCTYNFLLPSAKPGIIHIGKEYPTYSVFLLDEKLNLVDEGEICCAAFSLASGYLNLPEQTADRFVDHPTLGRVYRTGDIGRYLPDKSIQCLGRVDSQVKVNGYRIELGEVEAKILMIKGIKEAAVVFKNMKIHAFIVPHSTGIPDFPDGKLSLIKFNNLLHNVGLGWYAMPASVTVLDEMPRTVSGKIDRKMLVPKEAEIEFVTEITLADTIVNVFSRVLNHTVHLDSNFFEEGGDSSAAGKAVTQLRNSGKEAFKYVSVRDLYSNPTPTMLGKVLEDRASKNSSSSSSSSSTTASPLPSTTTTSNQPPVGTEPEPEAESMYHSWWIALVQFIVIIIELLIDGALVQAYVWPVIDGREWMFKLVGIQTEIWGPPHKGLEGLLVIHGLLLFAFFFILSLCVLWIHFLILFTLKWVLIGRYKAGIIRSRSFYLRHWIVDQFNRKFPWFIFLNGPFAGIIYRALGAKVGARVSIVIDSSAFPAGWDLMEFGDDCSVNNAFVSPITMTPIGMYCGHIKVGARASVHPRAILVGNNTIMDEGELGPLSVLEENAIVPAGEYWHGSPARKHKAPPRDLKPRGTEWSYAGFHLARTVIHFSLVFLLGVPGSIYLAFLIFLYHGLAAHYIYLTLNASALVFGFIFGVLVPPMVLRTLAFLYPSKPGTYYQYSFQSLMIQFKSSIFTIPTQGILNNTFYLAMWMRACGAKIGARSEMSKVKGVIPENMILGDQSFFTNFTQLATPEYVGGKMICGRLVSGNSVLIGNRSVIPCNTVLPDDVILGVLSVPPDTTRIVPPVADTGDYVLSSEYLSTPSQAQPPVKGHVTWVGNPAFELKHAKSDPYPTPTTIQYVRRWIWDVVAIFSPLILYFIFSQIWWVSFHFLRITFTRVPDTIWSGIVMILFRPTVPFVVAKLLYALLGRGLTPHQEDYWSHFNHRWHIYSKTWAFFVLPYFVKLLQGTIFMNLFYTIATNMKIGKNTLIVSCDGFREHDLLRIGSFSVVNSCSEFRTHTFENWKLKFEHVTVGDRCCIGHYSTLMGGSIMENDSEVGTNTLVMKKETLQSGICYTGLTAQPIGPSKGYRKKVRTRPREITQNKEKENDDYVIFLDD